MKNSARDLLLLALNEHNELRRHTYRALAKFHRETGCGEEHPHWAECSGAVDAWGFETWEDWVEHEQLIAAALAKVDS